MPLVEYELLISPQSVTVTMVFRSLVLLSQIFQFTDSALYISPSKTAFSTVKFPIDNGNYSNTIQLFLNCHIVSYLFSSVSVYSVSSNILLEKVGYEYIKPEGVARNNSYTHFD